jgi:hypothetical protein
MKIKKVKIDNKGAVLADVLLAKHKMLAGLWR